MATLRHNSQNCNPLSLHSDTLNVDCKNLVVLIRTISPTARLVPFDQFHTDCHPKMEVFIDYEVPKPVSGVWKNDCTKLATSFRNAAN